jgi:hypothetical protein
MTQTKFTKGPWKKDQRNESLMGEEGKTVGIYGCGLTGVTKTEESVANSTLIAFAPEMYSTIRELFLELSMAIDEVNTMRDTYIVHDTYPADHWDKQSCHDAEILLAKARGEL